MFLVIGYGDHKGTTFICESYYPCEKQNKLGNKTRKKGTRSGDQFLEAVSHNSFSEGLENLFSKKFSRNNTFFKKYLNDVFKLSKIILLKINNI